MFRLLRTCFFTTLFSVLLVPFLFGRAQGQIVLSEVMFDPAGSEYYDEFVELLNLGSETVNLDGWLLGDDTELDRLVDVGGGLLLAPGQYALVLDSGYFEHSTTYDSLIPAATLLLTIDDGAFGSGGLANSSPETVYLVSALGDTVAGYRYSLGNAPGFSDEKIDPAGGDNPANWADSRRLNGTPGFRNSVSRKQVDAAVRWAVADTLVVARGDPVRLAAAVVNVGQSNLQSLVCLLAWDRNADEEVSAGESLCRWNIPELVPGDSSVVECTWRPPGPGFFLLLSTVQASLDEDPENDAAAASVIVPFQPGEILLNEIYYRPAAGEPEWVELYNSGSDSAVLAGALLSDGTGRGTVTLPLATAQFPVPPRGYVVLAENASFAGFSALAPGQLLVPTGGFPSLNNSGDDVILRGPAGEPLDSLRYRPSWGGENGVSLERIRPDAASTEASNWASCKDESGSTPGRRNSVAPPDDDVAVLAVRAGTGGMRQVEVRVANMGLLPSRERRLDLTVVRGPPCQVFEQVALAQWALPSIGPADSLLLSTDWMPERYGPAWLHAALDPSDENPLNDTMRVALWLSPPTGSVVVNEIEFDPPSGSPEWVEVFNRGQQAISLDGWYLGDLRRRVRLDSNRSCVAAGGFALIAAKDAGVVTGLPPEVPVWATTSTWPGLNNQADAVALVDPAGQVIDSVFYFGRWRAGGRGSLERRLTEAPSLDSLNWAASGDVSGSTPGRLNDSTPRQADLAVGAVSVAAVRAGQALELSVWIRNVGLTIVQNATVSLFLDADGDSGLSASDLLWAEQTLTASLAPGDSLEVLLAKVVGDPGLYPLLAVVSHPSDERADNDVASVQAMVSPPPGAVVVNEFYPQPLSGQAEWIEFVNISNWDLDLFGWAIADDRGDEGAASFQQSLVLARNEMFVVASDSSFFLDWPDFTGPQPVVLKNLPALNDEGDQIVLRDRAGLVVDSLQYTGQWGVERGYSLEKLRPELPSGQAASWVRTTSTAGGTPGRPNSVYAYALVPETVVTVEPNPFSPDGDGFEDLAVVSVSLPVQVATVRLRVFDLLGRDVRTLLDDEPCGPQRWIAWDGKDQQGRTCRAGPYILLLEWWASGGKSGAKKLTVVLARR